MLPAIIHKAACTHDNTTNTTSPCVLRFNPRPCSCHCPYARALCRACVIRAIVCVCVPMKPLRNVLLLIQNNTKFTPISCSALFMPYCSFVEGAFLTHSAHIYFFSYNSYTSWNSKITWIGCKRWFFGKRNKKFFFRHLSSVRQIGRQRESQTGTISLSSENRLNIIPYYMHILNVSIVVVKKVSAVTVVFHMIYAVVEAEFFFLFCLFIALENNNGDDQLE